MKEDEVVRGGKEGAISGCLNKKGKDATSAWTLWIKKERGGIF